MAQAWNARKKMPRGFGALLFYKDYIKSPLWEKRKQAYFKSHLKACAICGDPNVELHHLKYGNYGREDDKDLALLCRKHHEALHEVVGVRKNIRYQSRVFIEQESEKDLYAVEPTDRLPEEVVIVDNRDSTFADSVAKMARPIWQLYRGVTWLFVRR